MGTITKDSRRITGFLILILVVGFGFWLVHGDAKCQTAGFPSKPVEILVPFAPGGSMDIVSRVLGEYMPLHLKVPVVIRNQAGGGGMTASAAYLRAKADGYSLLAGNAASLISTVQLAKNPPYDPRKDFLALGYVADVPFVMSVPKTSPFNSFDEFLQFARKNPGKLKGGFSMIGTEAHFAFLSIVRDAGIDVKQVPFTGAAQTAAALLGGHVDWVVKTVPATMPYIRTGDAKPLLVTRSTPELPNVPTGASKGLPNFNINLWYGLFVLPKVPKNAFDVLVSALEATVKNPEVVKKLTNIGFTVQYKGPAGCSSLVEEQWRTIAAIIKEMGLKVN